MKIEVLFFADLKDITKKEKDIIEINKNSLTELLKEIFQKYNSLKKILWDDLNKIIKSTISVAINEKIINNNSKHSLKLSDGDRVAFLLSVSGG